MAGHYDNEYNWVYDDEAPAETPAETDDNLTPAERIAKWEEDTRKESEANAPGALETIGGMTYRQGPGGVWEGDDGTKFSDEDYQAFKDHETATQPDSTGNINGKKPPSGLPDIISKVTAGAGTALALKALYDRLKNGAPSDAGYQGSVDMDRTFTKGVGYSSGPGAAHSVKAPVGIAAIPSVGTMEHAKPLRVSGPADVGIINLKDFEAGAQPAGQTQGFRAPTAEEIARDKANGTYNPNLQYAKGGGIAAAHKPTHYLRGDTDGMADQVPATIDGNEPARLAHGEFVVPADVVSHIGNGNSDAGAKKLYQMLAHIRKARTGNPEQGKQINPNKFLPGMKGMSEGGITDAVPRFDGTTGSVVPAGTPSASVSNLSTWAGPYVTNMMSDANALGNDMTANPNNYVFQGNRTAGTNPLLDKVNTTAAGMSVVNPNAAAAGSMQAGLVSKMANMPAYQAANVSSGYSTGPAYDPTKFSTTDFSQEAAQKYMNPYLKESLDPQLAEARRQSEISRMTNAGRLVGSGAFGGGRQAIMEAEGDRNLGQNLAAITGKGYDTAYTNAMSQFNADGSRKLQADQATEQSKQFGHTSSMTDRSNAANFGLQAAGINERSRESGARMGLDALQGAMTGAGQYGNFLNSTDANSRANLTTIAGLGNDQYTRDQAGITADMNKFNEEAALPGQALKFKQSMLQGLPITTTTPQAAPVGLDALAAATGKSVEELAKQFGYA